MYEMIELSIYSCKIGAC